MASKIEVLPDKVGGLVRACGILPTFHGIVEELILNSIDGRSKNIDIVLDLVKFSISIRDDGKHFSF